MPCRLGRLCRLQSFYTVSECFSSLLYSSNPDILYIAHRQFLSERFCMQRYSFRMVVK
nr:MAG TPA: hypothetical protein [Caudoviricetes sp.]DAM18419.1 MAG TPA: hypothetical protein [Caudoviricetes sp.]